MNLTGAEMITCWTLVQLITQEEASSVTILSPNADFNGQPSYAILVNGSWTEYEDKRYEGDTIMECLDAANRDRVHAQPDTSGYTYAWARGK